MLSWPTVPSHNKCSSPIIPFVPTHLIIHLAPDASGSSATHYAPYNKAHSHDSFQDGKKPILCLQCGIPGHHANACSSMHYSHPECLIICEWSGSQLVSNKNQNIASCSTLRTLR